MADVNINIFTNKIYKQGASTVVPGFIQGEEPTPINPSGSGGASEFVPYVGATENFDLGEFGMSAGFFKLDTTPTNTPTDQGTFYWDEDDNTVDIILNGYIMKVGEDLFYPVKNQTGSSIPKGTNVRFAGTVGNSGRLLITPYLADGTFATSRYMGVTAETIADGEDGKVLWFGRIRKINTNAYNEGDILYASTTSAGGFQTTLPVAPNNIVEVAAVVTKSVNNGVIFVRPQFLASGSKWTDVGSDIYRDSNVAIGRTTIPSNGTGSYTFTVRSKVDGVAGNSEYFLFENSSGVAGFIGQESGLMQINPTGASDGVLTIGNITGFSGARGLVIRPSSTGSSIICTDTAGTTAQFSVTNTGITFVPVTLQTGAPVGTTINSWGMGVRGRSSGISTRKSFIVERANGNEDFYIGTDGAVGISDANNVVLGTTTGTKIGTATSQKLSFWNATPIVQPTTGIAESAFVENSGGVNVNDDSTFDGYTLRQVVKALRDAGLLA
jgi:hypothetical protein